MLYQHGSGFPSHGAPLPCFLPFYKGLPPPVAGTASKAAVQTNAAAFLLFDEIYLPKSIYFRVKK